MAWIPAGFRSAAQALRYQSYRDYMIGNAVSASGLWMQRVAVMWLTWELTHSGFWLGAMAMADLLPSVIIGPIGGAYADRHDRMRMARVVQIISLVQSLVLAALVIFGLINIWALVVMTVLLGFVGGFGISVQFAITPTLIPREVMTSAVALNSVAFNVARFVGPAIGGLLIAHGGVTSAIIANSVTYLFFLVLLYRVTPLYPEATARDRRGLFGDILDGVRYSARHGGIAAMMVLLVAISLGARALTEILPKFSAVAFDGDASAFANMVAAIGLGGVAGGLWMSSRSSDAEGLTTLASVLTLTQAVIIMGLAMLSNIWIALPLLTMMGFALASSGIANQTMMQLAVAGVMRGRVMSLYAMVFRAGPAVGALLMGIASDVVGIRIPVFAAGLVVGAAGIWLWLRRDRVSAAMAVREESPAAATRV